jgi:GH25 family lysozyme M1 (1,4-beta-N-acetylmuramidase)
MSTARRLRMFGAVLVGVLLAALVAAPARGVPRPEPAGYPVSGIDVSGFQGPGVDWPTVASRGARFAYLRASEQKDIPDSTFPGNYSGAKANGLYAGAYHRARPDVSDGKTQADFLIDNSGYVADGRTLPPMLDIEWPRANWNLPACYGLTTAQLTAWIRDFVNEVQARVGRLPTIYTNTNWWNPCTGSDASFGASPLFIAGYLPAPPPLPPGWTSWTLWQYSDESQPSGLLPGDQDVLNGDSTTLAKLADGVPELAATSLLARANGKYVTAENGGASPLVANRTTIGGTWEQFDQVDAGGGFIALKARANGKYVTAENGGATALIANRTAISTWEKFTVIDNPDGTVSLLANANGKYVSADNFGTSPLIANRTAIGTWEKFVQLLPAAVVSLRAEINGSYVSADNAGALPLIANRTAIGAWEQYDQVNAGGGFVALKAHANGKYVTAENAGAAALVANRTAIGGWEKFTVIHHADGSISLLANANGKYVSADNFGSSPLIANRTEIGIFEKFQRIGP